MSNSPSKPVSFSRPKVGYFSNRPRSAGVGGGGGGGGGSIILYDRLSRKYEILHDCNCQGLPWNVYERFHIS